MDDNNEPIETVTRPASEHGWVRRSDLDGPTTDAYERPDGTWVLVPKGHQPVVISRLPPRHQH